MRGATQVLEKVVVELFRVRFVVVPAVRDDENVRLPSYKTTANPEGHD